jgi:hypothetical protein
MPPETTPPKKSKSWLRRLFGKDGKTKKKQNNKLKKLKLVTKPEPLGDVSGNNYIEYKQNIILPPVKTSRSSRSRQRAFNLNPTQHIGSHSLVNKIMGSEDISLYTAATKKQVNKIAQETANAKEAERLHYIRVKNARARARAEESGSAESGSAVTAAEAAEEEERINELFPNLSSIPEEFVIEKSDITDELNPCISDGINLYFISSFNHSREIYLIKQYVKDKGETEQIGPSIRIKGFENLSSKFQLCPSKEKEVNVTNFANQQNNSANQHRNNVSLDELSSNRGEDDNLAPTGLDELSSSPRLDELSSNRVSESFKKRIVKPNYAPPPPPTPPPTQPSTNSLAGGYRKTKKNMKSRKSRRTRK